jgi:hypothetical protein
MYKKLKKLLLLKKKKKKKKKKEKKKGATPLAGVASEPTLKVAGGGSHRGDCAPPLTNNISPDPKIYLPLVSPSHSLTIPTQISM